MQLGKEKMDLKWLKEHVSVIVLIPTVIGGLWQILALLNVGAAYIRFFSLSQLIPDGLLVLVFLGLVVLFSSSWLRVVIPFFRNFGKKTEKANHRIVESRDSTNEKSEAAVDIAVSKKSSVVKRLIPAATLLLFTIVLTFFIGPDLIKLYRVEKFKLGELLYIFASISFYIGIIIAIVEILEQNLNFSKFFKSWIFKVIGTLLFPFVVVGILWAFFAFLGIFHNAFALPDDFKNTKYLKCIVQSSNSELQSLKILYFNDKYIFVSITDKSMNKYIEVFRFDEFVNRNACDSNLRLK